jgi:hypothetical protein
MRTRRSRWRSMPRLSAPAARRRGPGGGRAFTAPVLTPNRQPVAEERADTANADVLCDESPALVGLPRADARTRTGDPFITSDVVGGPGRTTSAGHAPHRDRGSVQGLRWRPGCGPDAARRSRRSHHAKAELSVRIDRSDCLGRPLLEKLGLRLDAFPGRRRWPSVSSPAGSTATSARARSLGPRAAPWRRCATSSRRRSPPGTSPADP